jgi:hypothetical protein
MAITPTLIGVALLSWSLFAVLTTGSWLKAGALAGAAFLGLAAASVFFGFMADIASRLRRNQEELIYWQRLAAHGRGQQHRSAQASSVMPPGARK